MIKIKEKIHEKNWYRLILTEEGFWNTTLRIPTFDRIKYTDKVLIRSTSEKNVEFELSLDKEEYLIFKTIYKHYIVEFDLADKPKRTITVYK